MSDSRKKRSAGYKTDATGASTLCGGPRRTRRPRAFPDPSHPWLERLR
jgi:hypothetical protein